MINGLAAWHYPHRTLIENVAFFAEKGFSAVSLLGKRTVIACQDEDVAKELASVVKEKNIVLTVHFKLPDTHGSADVEEFKTAIDILADWQKKYGGLISVLSFDVPQDIRDNILPYVEYVLGYEEFKKVAVEDFGLTDDEKRQIEPLKNNERFGFLIDIGHMYIRLRGENKEGKTLFENRPSECEVKDKPEFDDFIQAFNSKEFPIFEIHLHNNDGVDDVHFFLDDGTLDVGMIADVLKAIEYDGILTLECAPGFKFECKYPESDERILKNFEYWKSLFEK